MTNHSLQIEDTTSMATASGYLRAAIFAVLIAIGAAAFIIGGSPYGAVCLAALGLPYLFREPSAATWYSTVFMLLAITFLPESFRGLGEGTPPEFYSWAVGLFLATLPPVIHFVKSAWSLGVLKPGSVRLPTPLVAFLAVSAAAALQGLRLGFAFSYVIRQAYGALIFCIYFAVALAFMQTSDEIFKAVRNVRWVALAVAVYTVTVYLDRGGEIGLFKQNLSVYSGGLACYCLGEFICAKGLWARLGWGSQIVLFILHPIVFSSRGAVGLFGITAVIAFGTLLRSPSAKYAVVVASLAFLILGVQLNLFAPVGQYLARYEGTERLIPEDVALDPSAIGRMSQVISAAQAAREHPFFGLGLGSELTFYDAYSHNLLTESLVDEGYAYLLSKFGIVGFAAFIWLIVSVMRASGWPTGQGLHLGLWLLFLFHLLYMVDGPVMFHFLSSSWAGATCGFLYRLRSLSFSSPSQHFLLSQQEGLA